MSSNLAVSRREREQQLYTRCPTEEGEHRVPNPYVDRWTSNYKTTIITTYNDGVTQSLIGLRDLLKLTRADQVNDSAERSKLIITLFLKKNKKKKQNKLEQLSTYVV